MKWFLKVLNQYADFKGRARRKEYWMFVLFQMIFAFAAMLIDQLIGFTIAPQVPYGYVYLLFSLGVMIPALAVAVRRLHDVGKSGWFLLIALIPIIGSFWLLYLFVKDSDPGKNKWGENPKGIGNNNAIQEIGTE